ncbi:MAG: hypothetical protein ACLVL7_12110 [Anaerotruncus massiliensis (ex Togo et al. 2019)]
MNPGVRRKAPANVVEAERLRLRRCEAPCEDREPSAFS